MYQLILKSMKLLPYHLYTKEVKLHAVENTTTKKRKACSDDGENKFEGQGSTKKTSNHWSQQQDGRCGGVKGVW